MITPNAIRKLLANVERDLRKIRFIGTTEVLWRIEFDELALGGSCKPTGSLRVDVVPKMLNRIRRNDRVHHVRIQQRVQQFVVLHVVLLVQPQGF